MSWLRKALGALARPLGISSPEDIRSHASVKTTDMPPLRVVVGQTPKPEPPKNPTSTQ
jgi:hypothetical protein